MTKSKLKKTIMKTYSEKLIDFKYQPIDLATLPKWRKVLVPGEYFIHSSGGVHPFKKFNDAPEKFHAAIWPWIERRKIKGRTKFIKNKGVLIPTFKGNGSTYLEWVLHGSKFLRFRRKHKESVWQTIRVSCHIGVGEAFLPNPDKKECFHHINNDKVDYRINNVEPRTRQENAVGNPKELRGTLEKFYLRWKDDVSRRAEITGEYLYDLS